VADTPDQPPRHTRPRPWILLVALAALLGACSPALAGRVLLVLSAEAPPYRSAEAAAQKALRSAGHATETVLLSALEGTPAETYAARADVILAIGTEAAVKMHERVPETLPLVYCMVANPRGAGLTSGKAAFGVSTDVPPKAQADLIASVLPKARAVGMLYKGASEASRAALESARAALPSGWSLVAVAVDEFKSPAAAVDHLMSQKIDVIWTTPDPAVYDAATARTLLLSAVRKRTPVFGFSGAVVRAGALVGVSVEPAPQGQAGAALAGDLLGGRAPPDVSPRDPEFGIAVNLIVANQIGVEVPADVVRRAAAVFKPE
jgi:putative tryptophan/tyrosine transport system substrate-binding protein